METQPPPPEDQPPVFETHRSPLATTLVKIMAGARYVFILASICTFVSSLALLIAGTVETIQMIMGALGLGKLEHEASLRTQALEIVDNFLVALVLIVLSFGFYQLMIAPNLPLPDWLRIRTPAEMEMKLIGVIITVAAVSGLVQIVNWKGGTDLLAFGLSVAALIVALGVYVGLHARYAHGKDE